MGDILTSTKGVEVSCASGKDLGHPHDRLIRRLPVMKSLLASVAAASMATVAFAQDTFTNPILWQRLRERGIGQAGESKIWSFGYDCRDL
jgi:hypothetical protein